MTRKVQNRQGMSDLDKRCLLHARLEGQEASGRHSRFPPLISASNLSALCYAIGQEQPLEAKDSLASPNRPMSEITVACRRASEKIGSDYSWLHFLPCPLPRFEKRLSVEVFKRDATNKSS